MQPDLLETSILITPLLDSISDKDIQNYMDTTEGLVINAGMPGQLLAGMPGQLLLLKREMVVVDGLQYFEETYIDYSTNEQK